MVEAWPWGLGHGRLGGGLRRWRVRKLLGKQSLWGCQVAGDWFQRAGRVCWSRSGGTSGTVTRHSFNNHIVHLKIKSVFSILRHTIGIDGFSPQKATFWVYTQM